MIPHLPPTRNTAGLEQVQRCFNVTSIAPESSIHSGKTISGAFVQSVKSLRIYSCKVVLQKKKKKLSLLLFGLVFGQSAFISDSSIMCYVQEMCERRKGEEKNYNHTHPKVFPEWSRNGPIGILKSEQPQTCSLFSTGIVFLYDLVHIISVRHSLHPQWSMRADSADWPGSPGQGSLWHIYCVIVTQKWDAANQSERSNNRLTLTSYLCDTVTSQEPK